MKNRYSISEFIKNIYSFILTKITMHKARFIRRPVYIRGKKAISGCNRLTLGRLCRFDLNGPKGTLVIGNNCEMGDMTHIVAYNKVDIGNNVLIASKVFISDTDHGAYSGTIQSSPYTEPQKRELVTGTVKIGDNTWIGENVVILRNSSIGKGCIIGANSVVKGVFPDNCIIAGAPAKVIKKWNDELGIWDKEK